MPLDLDLGVDLDVTDEPLPATPRTATDTGFLLTTVPSGEPQTVQEILSPGQARTVYPTATQLHAEVDAYFGAGGGRLLIAPLTIVAPATTPDVGASEALFGAGLGPGQLMAPSVVAAADQAILRDRAWDKNRIYIAQAPAGATVAALTTLVNSLINAVGGRFAHLEADHIVIPGTTPGTTRTVGASVVTGGLMARSDRVTGNPGLSPAGNHTPGAAGQVEYALSISGERTVEDQKTLARAQVNAYRTVNGKVRKYGVWTAADLDVLPHWWDIGGSRVIMAVRAMEQSVAEELMFGQVTADGAFLDRYKGALSSGLAEFQRIGAIYGTDADPGYHVDVSGEVNPLADVARGIVTAQITLKTSTPGVELRINVTRRAINDQVA